jgi:intracellular multiplication protein IcmG
MASMYFKGQGMVKENYDENYEGEEGEYQFSDDQINYDVDSETKDVDGGIPQPTSTKQKILEKIGPYRRMLIGLVVFAILLFIIYKMLAPTNTAPPTEFSPNVAAKPIPTTQTLQQPVMPTASATPPQPKAEVAITATQPAQPEAGMPSMPSQSLASQTPVMPSAVPPSMPATTPQASSPPAGMAAAQAPQGMLPTQQMPVEPSAAPTETPAAVTTEPPLPPVPVVQSEIANRIASLEAQNASLMNMQQNQINQKMMEYELQNKATQDRMLALNKRLANMEATLNKMAQMMREGGGRVRSTAPAPERRSAEPKMIYTVQAIIPGRAWLKSDTGDTVTVAEGDLLKDYGRVSKIDPYDGIVQIDTGSRVITLSYGAGGE